jgi:hypothetical protein
MANYRLAELDFDDIKVNLKQFLTNYRDKDNNLIFKDYDFEASSLSILLDLLSYNTHYNAYLANMVANEMFLDSVVKRESAVSIAKHLGYRPLSYRSAKAKVSFTINNPVDTPPTLTLPKFSPFTTTINNTQYTFSNLDAISIKPTNGVYTFTDVEITEGEALSYVYRVDLSGPDEKYTIPNKNIDTTTIRVTVQNSYTDLVTQSYTLTDNLEALNSESKVFFLEENPSGFYEIFFGDNVLGKRLFPGNLVKIEYLISNGSFCNVSGEIEQRFSLGVQVGGVSLASSIIAATNSSGGDEPDTLEDIKFKAPRFLSSFNRAVTAKDYKAIIESNYPLVESVSVWGGEENIPPKYGKVIISLKPYFGYTINTELKNKILQDILQDKKIMSIIPEFVDPNYLHITLDTKVKFDPANSRYTPPEIQILVKAKIEEYFSVELQKFDKDFVYSRLSKTIDSINSSIVGNVTSFRVHKRITPVVNISNSYAGATIIKFANKLLSGTIQSTGFYYKINDEIKAVYFKDVLTTSGTSNLNLYDLYTDSLLVSSLGTVDYVNGTISIASLNPAGYIENSSDIRFYAKIEELDINATKDLILIIDDGTLDTTSKRLAGLTVTVTTQ